MPLKIPRCPASAAPEPSQAQPAAADPAPSLGAIHAAITSCLTRLDTFDRRLQHLETRSVRSGSSSSGSASDSTERGSGRAASPIRPSPHHSTPHRSRPPPPHMTGSTTTPASSGAAPTSTSAASPPTGAELSPAVLAFRSFSTEDKIAFRSMLKKIGTSMEAVVSGIDNSTVPPEDDEGDKQNEDDSQGPSTSRSAKASADATGLTKGAAATTSGPMPDFDSNPRVRHCNPKYLPEFRGRALELEDWISRVRDIVRSDPDSQWELAVLRAIPIRFDDAAKDWHASLRDDEIKAITSFDQLAEAMRLEFPPNRAEQRRLARGRAWKASIETPTQYYFAKLRALRSAFGDDQPDHVLVQDIVDGLPATFRGLLRLPPRHPVLADLRYELGERESIWKEIYMPAEPPPPSPAPTTMARSVSAPAQPRVTVQSAGSPISASVAVKRSTTTSAPPSVFARPGLAATYDPSRVIPAKDGKPRRYRRPGDDQVIELNHPCTRCGQDHFNFEHRHLETSAHVLEVDDDDYPVASEGDDQDF
ncbi:hypothetical protein OC844_007261 [Tilletia horrida]|nr:hypothetical protein OC844_007261 [Tilletia horrida]